MDKYSVAMWNRISSIHLWRHLFRLPAAYLQRCLTPSRVVLPISTQSDTFFTRTLRHRCSHILPLSSNEAIGCVATVTAMESHLNSNGHGYYHHGQYHRHGQSHANSTNSTFAVIPMLGVGLVLCSSPTQDEGWKFTRAAREGDIQAMKKLLKSGVDVNCRHPLGWSALHTAVINTNWPVVEFLVENGTDMNSKDEFSSAPRVATQERVSSTQVAIARDRDFSDHINHFASYSGFTALHYAVVVDDETLIWYLLEHGADPTVENNLGYAPSRYCTNERVKALLDEYTIKAEERKLQEKLEERRKFPLEEQLSKNIVGQEGPITSAAAAIRRREMGWADEEHPLVFLFLGSSGIGKTELAKQIANYIHKDKKEGFIRLDMSEYQEKHEVAKLIGAPPGYVGYDQGGQLTSRLRECPNALVLFDEVDKAHPDVLTVLLQLFDEGRLTDGQGKTISCKDAIFVMTSNLANEEIAAHALQLRKEARTVAKKYRKSEKDEEHIEISRDFKEQVVEPILKHQFKRDEFLGRINEILYFLPFSRTELHRLVERELELWRERASKRHRIKLSWTKEVLDVLADGYNVKYGARSIHHEVERKVVNLLAAAYEQGSIARGSQVELVVEQEGEERRSVIRIKDAGKTVAVDVSNVSSQLLPFY